MNLVYNMLRNLNVITDKGKQNPKSQRILDKNPSLMMAVYDATKFLSEETELRARLHCIMHNITVAPTCNWCQQPTTFNKPAKQFNNYCCLQCAWQDPKNVERAKQTRKHKYGDENYNNRDKAEKTNIERFGSTTPAGNPTILKKIRSHWNDEKVKNAATKRAKTNVDKYGATTFAASTIDKDTANTLKDYNKMYELFVKKGYTIIELSKMLNTSLFLIRKSLLTHGLTDSSRRHLLLELQRQYGDATLKNIIADDDLANILMKDYRLSKVELAFVLQCHATYVYNHASQLDFQRTTNKSTHERDVLTFIESIIDPSLIITNTKRVISPYELDIFIPHLNIAIEYNGVFWHSELNGKDRSYHNIKHELCKQQGIQLIGIWSSEWINNNTLVKNRLKSKLIDAHVNIVYARNCIIRPLLTHEERDFFNTNHAQGYLGSTVCYGLFYNDQLVSAMSFVGVRFDESDGYEMLRFATSMGWKVNGGAGKLFKHFLREINPERVISYSMRRWNTGNVYQQLGFNYSHTSKPNYFYFDRNGDSHKLLSRVNFQKHKLPNILANFDPAKSEWENMVDNGYDRIWDCGNDVWIWLQPK